MIIGYRSRAGILFLLLAAILLAGGCEAEKRPGPPFSAENFKLFYEKAKSGDKVLNDSLRGIVDLTLPQQIKYNKMVFDSILTKDRKHLYSVLIEYENPVFNRFAVYDSAYNLYLMDKSLNGYLSYSKGSIDSIQYFEVLENFRSKDDINLKRLSIYTLRKNEFELAWRSYIEYAIETEYRQQLIEALTPAIITTRIEVEPKLKLVDFKDTFFFDSTTNSYESNKRVFDRLVDGWVAKYKKNVSDSQITDLASALRSIGTTTSVDSVHKFNNEKNKKAGFSIFIPEGWRVGRDVFISKFLKKPMKGALYSNISQGASISVIEIGGDDMAENHVDYILDQSVQRYYTVRFNDNVVVKKNYVRFFEISCIDKKYLIIFEAPIFSYEKNKQMYSDIINSFGVEC